MKNPFTTSCADEEPDEDLVAAAVGGDRTALEKLVARHQTWIYNIALRMVWEPSVAEDVTQDVLLKVITRLASFEGRSQFRTWLYRIVSNHVLSMKHTPMEPRGLSFAEYGAGLDSAPDLDLPDPKSVPVDHGLLVEEAKLGCTTGMLLCLDRPQRLVFILGEVFAVPAAVGAEVLEMSKDNFRQVLSRARRDLREFMAAKCGLVDPSNPCRCRKKTSAFIQRGYVDPDKLRFSGARTGTVAATLEERVEGMDRAQEAAYTAIYRSQPFHEPADQVGFLQRLLESPQVRQSFEI